MSDDAPSRHDARSTPLTVSLHRVTARAVRLTLERFLLLPIGAVIALVWANTAPESYFLFALALVVPRQRSRHGALLRAAGAGSGRSRRCRAARCTRGGGGRCRSSRPPAASSAPSAVYLGYVQLAVRADPGAGLADRVRDRRGGDVLRLKAILPRSGALPFVLLLAIVTDIVGMLIVAPRHLGPADTCRRRGAR